MKEIAISKGYTAIVDDSDYDWISQYRWMATIKKSKSKTYCYPMRFEWDKGDRTVFLMHREIAQPGEGFYVDHINGDCLDNRRANLRVCTHSQNMSNRVKRAKSASKYKGLWKDRSNKWRAEIKVSGKRYRLGSFHSEIEAAKAYDRAALEHLGEFAQLNFG